MALGNVNLLTAKTYNPNGVILMSMYYGGNWYLALDDGDDFPLLDSKFPDLSSKGHGYNIQCYPAGVSGWPQLRKMSIWRIGGDEDDLSLVDERVHESNVDESELILIENQSLGNDGARQQVIEKHSIRLKAKIDTIGDVP